MVEVWSADVILHSSLFTLHFQAQPKKSRVQQAQKAQQQKKQQGTQRRA